MDSTTAVKLIMNDSKFSMMLSVHKVTLTEVTVDSLVGEMASVAIVGGTC